MNFAFDAEKAAEAAMLFLSSEKKEATVLKLVKLMYLAERESFEKREVPLFGGHYFSLQHGPVPSEAYNLMKGEGPEKDQEVWDQLIQPRDGNGLQVRKETIPESLSASEVRLIREVHARHADKSAWELREWCHAHIPEYEEISSGRRPINVSTLALKVGADIERVNEESKACAFFRNAS